ALFLGEWLLGSIGWGVLHGVLLFSAIAVAAILLALGVAGRRLARAFLIAAAIGAAVAVMLALDAPNRLYTALGDGLVPGVEPGVRPLVVGTALGALLGLVVGAVMALRLGSGGSRIIALAGAVIVGALIGAFSAITFGVQIGIGLGLAVGYLAWIALMATEVARGGVDFDALKARFYPSQTIDTSKETLEWLQRRMPPGIGS
nr:hypothetical protein [Chloroflexota bacterium]